MPLPPDGARAVGPKTAGSRAAAGVRILHQEPCFHCSSSQPATSVTSISSPPSPNRLRGRSGNARSASALSLIQLTSHQPFLNLFGTTVSGRQVDIRALVSGQIVETGDSLREGGIVKEGELLLKIDAIDYRTSLAELEAQLAEARARIVENQASLASGKQSLANARDQLELAQVRRGARRTAQPPRRGLRTHTG